MSKFRQFLVQKSAFFHMNWIKSQLSKAEELFPHKEDTFWARNAFKNANSLPKNFTEFYFFEFLQYGVAMFWQLSPTAFEK